MLCTAQKDGQGINGRKYRMARLREADKHDL